MCCIFESYARKENPLEIRPPEAQPSFFDASCRIETDGTKADRVYQAIPRKISAEAQDLVRLGFLTCNSQKEMMIYRFLRLGFQYGPGVMNRITDDGVFELQKAVRHLTMESHKLKGFIRFSVYDQVLIAVIEPKNLVLPLLAAHFCDRYRRESFMIYDKVHGMALIYQDFKAELISLEHLVLPEIDGAEEEYRSLWKQFYQTIAIESRYNPRCRMSLMPKRYWKNMTEFL